jgi:HAD superfamily hydrolase (TIGR01509 family)
MQLPPEYVIFDCDGVLVDSEPVTNRVLQANLARYGLDMSLTRIVELFVGGTMPGVMAGAREHGAALPDGWLDEIYGEMYAALERDCPLVEGVLPVLDALDAADIPYAVGSNGPHAKMRITLTRIGLKPRLAGRIVSREDVANPKPAPDVYLRAASLGGVPPARCVVIEDSASGARAAQAAGMTCFGYTGSFPASKLAPHCDATFAAMSDLPALLGLPA